MIEAPTPLDKKNLPSPPVQAMAALGLSLFTMCGTWVINATGLMSIDVEFYWVTSGAFILLFAVLNSIASIGQRSFGRYAQLSFPSFLSLLVLSSLAAWFFSGLNIFETSSFRSVYILLIMAYFTLFSIGVFIKTVATWLHNEEQRKK